jgi:hypothetical protein
VIPCHDFGCFGRRSPIVSFGERSPSLTSESVTAPLKALAVLAIYAQAIVDADGPPGPQVGNPGGANLTLLAAPHHRDGTRRATAHGDQFLQRTV